MAESTTNLERNEFRVRYANKFVPFHKRSDIRCTLSQPKMESIVWG